tara:strand:- start:564 stop:1328 length:765 start_codon:yes stop_codon:yes gene_type:complete
METLVYTFETPLLKSKIIKRPSKDCKSPYVADLNILNTNENTLAHTPALGCCGLTDNNSCVYALKKENSKICTHSVELSILENNKLVGCNPKMAELLIDRSLQKNYLSFLKNVKNYRREKKIKNSRFDFYGVDENNIEFVMEVKNVPLAKMNEEKNEMISFFPDGYRKSKKEVVSPRALKHIQELEELKIEKKDNIRCILCFVIQRNDISSFMLSENDEIYKEAVLKAKCNGVEIRPVVFEWYSNGNAHYIKEL